MKYKFIFLISLVFFSHFSFGNTISVFQNGYLLDKMLTPGYGYVYKVVDTIVCTTSSVGMKAKVYYNQALLGDCSTSTDPADGYKIPERTSGDLDMSFSCSSLPCGGDTTPLSIHFYQKRPVLNDYQDMGSVDGIILTNSYIKDASLADSVSFPELKSNTSQSKPLVNPIDSAGKLTIKPSAVSGGMGIIEDESNHNQISYTIEGATWDSVNSEWVIQSNEQDIAHNLIINPSQSKITGGKYSGYVTVTLFSN